MLSFSPILLLGAIAALPALADPDAAPEKGAAPAKTARAEVPDGFVIIEENIPVDLKQLPVDFLRAADTDFNAKNLGEAAGELRGAARVFRLESQQAKGENRHLLNAAEDLDQLATDVKNMQVKSADAFRSQLARALYHEAEHHRLQARHAFEAKQYRGAGDDLRAAAIATEASAKWAGKDLYANSKGPIERARTVAMQLANGEGWAKDDVTAALDRLDGAMAKIAGVVMPSSDKAKAQEAGSEM